MTTELSTLATSPIFGKFTMVEKFEEFDQIFNDEVRTQTL